ncbi:MAG: alanine racemase [Proteobacteria bacterium]|nr:alanine racemase [Pseudomonadota bacterium]
MPPDNDPAALSRHPTWMEIDAAALRHNLAEVRRRVMDGVQIIASVKANAYGHGIQPVARILAAAGVDMLATGSFAEACALRDAGVRVPVLLLAGALPEAMGAVLARGFIPTVYDLDGARAVDQAAGAPTPVFVKVDCGLGRVGVALDEAAALLDDIAALRNIRVQGLYTHVSFNDSQGMAYTQERLRLFYDLLGSLQAAGVNIPITQALASSALLMGWRDNCTAVCPGHILFGLSPVAPDLAGLAPFRPVLRAIKSRVLQVRDHSSGPDTGTGGYHRNRRQRRTAVAPCGMNDGYRAPVDGHEAQVLHFGRPLRVIGVSLEHLTVEVPDDVEIAVGDELVVVAGDGPVGLHDVAAWQKQRPLETLMTFSARMPVLAV